MRRTAIQILMAALLIFSAGTVVGCGYDDGGGQQQDGGGGGGGPGGGY